MAIKNISDMAHALKNYDAKGWTRKANIEIGSESDILTPAKSTAENGDVQSTFGEVLEQSIGKVNKLQTDANVAIEKLMSGESKNIHETLVAVEKADIAFKMMNQIRHKVIDAYKEIMKMQV